MKYNTNPPEYRYNPEFRLTWSDDMTDDEKYFYMLEVNRHQLIDHIISGDEDTFLVYGRDFHDTFTSYEKALEAFIQAKGYCTIALYTRIGTSVVLETKGDK